MSNLDLKLYHTRLDLYLYYDCIYKNVFNSYLASRTRAKIPAANGAEAEVPVCASVQVLCKSAVTY
jgi:hypothetical protein